MQKRKTYGEILNEQRGKSHTLDDDPIEYARNIWKDVMATVKKSIENVLATGGFGNQNFYIAVHVTKDIWGVPIYRPYPRLTCSTPVYNLIVFKYHRASSLLEFVYQIPHEPLCTAITLHPVEYLKSKEYNTMAKTVLLWNSGELEQWVIKQCGEQDRKQIGLTVKRKKE